MYKNRVLNRSFSSTIAWINDVFLSTLSGQSGKSGNSIVTRVFMQLTGADQPFQRRQGVVQGFVECLEMFFPVSQHQVKYGGDQKAFISHGAYVIFFGKGG